MNFELFFVSTCSSKKYTSDLRQVKCKFARNQFLKLGLNVRSAFSAIRVVRPSLLESCMSGEVLEMYVQHEDISKYILTYSYTYCTCIYFQKK